MKESDRQQPAHQNDFANQYVPPAGPRQKVHGFVYQEFLQKMFFNLNITMPLDLTSSL